MMDTVVRLLTYVFILWRFRELRAADQQAEQEWQATVTQAKLSRFESPPSVERIPHQMESEKAEKNFFADRLREADRIQEQWKQRLREAPPTTRPVVERLAERVRRAIKHAKEAVIIGMIGMASAVQPQVTSATQERAHVVEKHKVEASAETVHDFELEIDIDWIDMIPDKDSVASYTDEGDVQWTLERDPQRPETLEAFDRMKQESAAVLQETVGDVPSSFMNSSGLSRIPYEEDFISVAEKLTEEETPQSAEFQSVTQRFVERMSEIQERYEEQLSPVLEIAGPATELMHAFEDEKRDAKKISAAREQLANAFAKIGVRAQYEERENVSGVVEGGANNQELD